MNRKYVFIIILLFSALACSLINRVTPSTTPTALSTQAVITQKPTGSPTAAPVGTQAPVLGLSATPTVEEPTKTPYPTSVLDTQMRDEVNLIQSQVAQERGLQPKSPVPVVLITSNELRNNVVNDFLADYSETDAADDVYFYSSIGLLDPGFDFRNFFISLLNEQTAGYYENDTKEMFIVSDQGFTGVEHFTYAHEYTHALQDQYYDIKNGLKRNTNYCDVETEYCAAILALIEGDATLSALTWFQNDATQQDQEQMVEYYNNFKEPIYDSAPAFLKDDFMFPYSQGLSFVQFFHDQGGWSAVDAIYKNPPVSTEQILHPTLYPSDAPIPVDLPELTSALGDGWREVARREMGEWYTYLVLARGINPAWRLDDTTAETAAAGWGGDRYAVLHNDSSNQTAFVMKTVWDATKDAAEFSDALQKSLNSRFGLRATHQGDTFTWSYSSGYSSLLLSGNTTIWIITPDAAMAQTISGLVQP